MFEIKYTKEELKEKFNIEIWSSHKIQEFRKIVLDWYDKQAHDFPWRQTKKPYNIWISEIMLQQTRVDTVIPYYKNFMEKFPTIEDLASASEDKVLKAWEGLGYYSRARNLKKAAEQIMLRHEGEFPSNPAEIIELMGIGPYTTGAIASMAFNLPIPAIDGNLMRVLSRLFEIDLDISKAKNRKVFETVALYLIDPDRPGDFNQALMDLGRTVCTPKNYFPEQSPVKKFNASYINDTWQNYPVKNTKNKPRPVSYVSLVIQNNDGQFLLKKRPATGLLANMWMFPLIEVEKILTDGNWKLFKQEIIEKFDKEQEEFVRDYFYEHYNISIKLNSQTIGVVDHIFSHLIWNISIFEGITIDGSEIRELPENCEWVDAVDFNNYVFPTVQKKLWQSFNEVTLF